MGKETEITETNNAPLLLSRMGNDSPLESTVAELKMMDTEDLTRDEITTDLIHEWKRHKGKDANETLSKNYAKTVKRNNIKSTASSTRKLIP